MDKKHNGIHVDDSNDQAGVLGYPDDQLVARIFTARENIGKRDARWASGSEARQPVEPFRFLANDDDTTGSTPKIDVSDARGVIWGMKFGEEVHADVAAPHLAWLLGYATEESYFVATGHVVDQQGSSTTGFWSKLTRAKTQISVADGSFSNVRFKRKPRKDYADNHLPLPTAQPGDLISKHFAWGFGDADSVRNPFYGTREESGLALINLLLDNWDFGSRNNRIFIRSAGVGQRPEAWFGVSDYGASFAAEMPVT